MMWELLQITILGTNSKIVGTRTFRKFPYVELTLNYFQNRKEKKKKLNLWEL